MSEQRGIDTPSSVAEGADRVRTGAFQLGDVVRYTPRRDWCRHGIAVVQDDGHGRDTYWMSGDGSYVAPENLADGELMFRMGDYRSVDREDEWIKYAERDRQSFPMGGYPRRLFVRAAAEPDLETRIQNAYRKLREAEEALKSAGRSIEWAARDIAGLEAQRDPNPSASGSPDHAEPCPKGSSA